MLIKQAVCYALRTHEYIKDTFTPLFCVGLLLLSQSFRGTPYLLGGIGLILIVFYFFFEYALCPADEVQNKVIHIDSYSEAIVQYLNPAHVKTVSCNELECADENVARNSRAYRLYSRFENMFTKSYNFASSFLLSMCAQLIASSASYEEQFNGPSLSIPLVGAMGMLLCGARRYLPSSIEQRLEICSAVACGLGTVFWAVSAKHVSNLAAPLEYATGSLLTRLACLAYALYIKKPVAAAGNSLDLTRHNCLHAFCRRLTVLGGYILFNLWVHLQPSVNLSMLMAPVSGLEGSVFARVLWISGLLGLASNFTVKYHSANNSRELTAFENGKIFLLSILPPFLGMTLRFVTSISNSLLILSATTIMLGGTIIPLIMQFLPLLKAYYTWCPEKQRHISMCLSGSYIGFTIGVLIVFIMGCATHTLTPVLKQNTLSTYLPNNQHTTTPTVGLTNYPLIMNPLNTVEPPNLFNRREQKPHTKKERPVSKRILSSSSPKRVYIAPSTTQIISDCLEYAHVITEEHQNTDCKPTTAADMFDNCQLLYFTDDIAFPIFNYPGFGILAIIEDKKVRAVLSNARKDKHMQEFKKNLESTFIGYLDDLKVFALIAIHSETQLTHLLENHQKYAPSSKWLTDKASCSFQITDKGYQVLTELPPHLLGRYKITDELDGSLLVQPTFYISYEDCMPTHLELLKSCPTISEVLLQTCTVIQPTERTFTILYMCRDSLWCSASFRLPSLEDLDDNERSAEPKRDWREGHVRQYRSEEGTGKANGKLQALYENIADSLLRSNKTEEFPICRLKPEMADNRIYKILVVLQGGQSFRLRATNTTAEILADPPFYFEEEESSLEGTENVRLSPV